LAVARFQQNVFLRCAGTDKPCYITGEPVRVGAELLCLRDREWVRCQTRVVSVGKMPTNKLDVLSFAEGIAAPIDGMTQAENTYETLPPGEYRVTITLFARDGKTVRDALMVPFRVLSEKDPPSDPGDFVRVQEGEFVLHGRPWRPVGI